MQVTDEELEELEQVLAEVDARQEVVRAPLINFPVQENHRHACYAYLHVFYVRHMTTSYREGRGGVYGPLLQWNRGPCPFHPCKRVSRGRGPSLFSSSMSSVADLENPNTLGAVSWRANRPNLRVWHRNLLLLQQLPTRSREL